MIARGPLISNKIVAIAAKLISFVEDLLKPLIGANLIVAIRIISIKDFS